MIMFPSSLVISGIKKIHLQQIKDVQ